MDLIRSSLFRWLLTAFACLVGSGASAQALDTTSQRCLTCHSDMDAAFKSTKHGVRGDSRTPFGSGKGCTACHGDPARHLESPSNPISVKFGAAHEVEPQNEACLACHKGGKRMNWAGSAHERTAQSCANCHNIHAAKDQVTVAATQAGVCFTCHKDKRAESMRFSTHPLKTGAQPCSSCHNPHGSTGEYNLLRATVNETCYTCHADKRGPFLWEHPPAREDCSLCHNPHGSNIQPMLKARQPWLCQQCHSQQFHPSTQYSGNNIPPFPAGGTAAQQTIAQGCANCHSKVHGSNHPSGARFTR